MSYMKDKVFIDTNILVYAFLDYSKDNNSYLKHIKAKEFCNLFKMMQKL